MKKVIYVILLACLLTSCNLSSKSKPEPLTFPTRSPEAENTPYPTATQLSGADFSNYVSPTPLPATSEPDFYTKMTNFVDDAADKQASAPASGEKLVCGKKYLLTYPGIQKAGEGIWFWIGHQYGFSNESPEMNEFGYYRDSYLNWVGKKNSYSPGFDALNYKAGNQVSFPFYLKCPK